jgi:hypothetical protein
MSDTPTQPEPEQPEQPEQPEPDMDTEGMGHGDED